MTTKKLTDSMVMKILDRLGESLYCDLYYNRKDLNIYYDEIKTGCFVYCCDYSVLINIELDQDNGKIEVSKEDEFSNGLQYYTTFKLKDFINDNNKNE